MVRSILFLLLLILANASCLGDSATYEPYSDWYDLSGIDIKYINIAMQLRDRQIPDKKEVKIDRFPDAKLLALDPETFIDEQKVSDGLVGMVLVSATSKDEVVSWYKKKLVGFSEFEIPTGTLFIEGSFKNFYYPKDTGLFTDHRHLIISENKNSEMKMLAPNYPTFIEITYRPAY